MNDNSNAIIKKLFDILNKEKRKARKLYYKNYHRNYKKINKEIIKMYNEKYYQSTKQKRNEKFTCPCGGRYTKNNKSIHERTTKHQQYIHSII